MMKARRYLCEKKKYMDNVIEDKRLKKWFV